MYQCIVIYTHASTQSKKIHIRFRRNMQNLAAPNTHLQCGEDNGSVNDKVASGSPLPCDMRISGRAVRRVHGVGAALCGHG